LFPAGYTFSEVQQKETYVRSVQRTKPEVASIIEEFLNGTGSKWDWDDFCSNSVTDPYLDSVSIQCRELHLTFPPEEKGHYCGQAGIEIK
jgi:hypothetical protein